MGRRLIFQPGVFQHSCPREFPDVTRRTPIEFRHAWTESDSVVIFLPDSMALDRPEVPASGSLGNFGRYDVSLGVANQGTILVYRRTFVMNRTELDVADSPDRLAVVRRDQQPVGPPGRAAEDR